VVEEVVEVEGRPATLGEEEVAAEEVQNISKKHFSRSLRWKH
jgi:hypothetical protein